MASANNLLQMARAGALNSSARNTLRKPNLKHSSVENRKYFSGGSEKIFRILGIETSCDDTGCAIVDSNRNLLGEALHSQMQIHLENGGIIPPIAGKMHRDNMETVVTQALNAAGLTLADIDAVAATAKPGLKLSLEVGVKYGCYLSRQWRKPFIPIHHMKAHALTARMVDLDVKFPFLTLLISGGHSLLALAKDVETFYILGETLDLSPGETLDKVSRQMKLRNIPELSTFSGGQAVETMARKAQNPEQFSFSVPLTHIPSCDFSFSGMFNKFRLHLKNEEERHGTPADGVVESASDLCAAFQLTMARHFCHRVERAMTFAEEKGMISDTDRCLVVSGGVACNQFFAKAFKMVCDAREYHLSIPPPKLCNDNGVMIAWNGIEHYKRNIGVLPWDQLHSIQIETKSPIGTDIRREVEMARVTLNWVKLKNILRT